MVSQYDPTGGFDPFADTTDTTDRVGGSAVGLSYDSEKDQFFIQQWVSDANGLRLDKKYLTGVEAAYFAEHGTLPPASPTASPGGGSLTPAQQASLAEDQRQFDATLAQRMAEYEQSVREWNANYQLDLQRLALQQDQLTLAEQQGRSQEARDIAKSVTDIQGRMNDNLIQLSQMRNNALALNAQLQQQVSLANSQQAFQAAQSAADRTLSLFQLTEQMRSRNIDQQIQIAGQIADYTKDPGDIVANIAAEQQFGSISTALAHDFTGLTDQALRVGGLNVENQDRARAEGQRLSQQSSSLAQALERTLNPTFGYSPAQAASYSPDIPTLTQPDYLGLFNRLMGTGQAVPTGAPAASGQTLPGGFTPQQGADLLAATATKDASGAQVVDPSVLVALGLLSSLPTGSGSSGGLVDQAQQAPTAGNVVVSPTGQVQTDPFFNPGGGNYVDPQSPESPFSFADGGVGLFNSPTTVSVGDNGPEALIAVKPESIARARQLLFAAFQPVFERFKASLPNIPTFAGGVAPVAVSAPGTSPDLQQAAAALTAAGSGVKRSAFFNDLLRSQATGINPGVISRAR